jgi:predicted ATPase/class 3 adenylate cyclase
MPEPHPADAPLAGTVTFLFTDIEGSTALWEQDGARMSQALAAHDALARRAVEGHRGTVVKMTGDGMHAVFDDALDALAAAVDLQQALVDPVATNGVPLRVRCGLHAGMVERRDNDYFGSPVNRAARIMSAAHGGQVLLSQAVAAGVREILPPAVALRDLGRVRLKDLSTPEHVYQVLHPQLLQEFPALRSLEATPNNLPHQVTSFIGRDKESAELRRRLAINRLLTLTGAGGCGKTRLCLQVAADALEQFPDGVWLVELAPLVDPGLVPQTVATVLGLKEAPGKPIRQTLTDYLKDKRLLLLLDNCEQLLDGCAQLADALLRQCPQVKILASSREPLGMGGEQAYRVPSLSLPDPKQTQTPASIAPFEAVQLFTDRALLARPDFKVTHQNAAMLASICYRLDGIPLAIELAAARVRALSIEEINSRLDQRFLLLTGGSRTALPRQQTLRSLIDWSYDLLNDPEKRLLQRLSIFAGGWTLAAAEQVCGGDGVVDRGVLDLLTSLCDKSMVLVEQNDGHYRYRLMETVREYARERLLEKGGDEAVRDRHLDYFLALAEEAEPKLTGAEQAEWLQRLDEEHDNLRSALTWSSGGDAGSGLRLAGALWWFWYARGYFGEGRSWLSGLLAAAPSAQAAAARAKALNGAGRLARQQSDYPAAQALLNESLTIQRKLGDRRGIATSLNNLGLMAWDQGDYPSARTLYEESLAIRRELGDRWGIAVSLNNLGGVAFDEGDYVAARALHEESLAIRRELGDRRGIASSLGNLGNVAYAQGHYPVSRALFEESLTISREVGDRQGIGFSLGTLGNVAAAQGDNASARAFFKQSLAIRLELGDRWGIAEVLEGLSYVALALAKPGRAIRIDGAAERLRQEIGSPLPSNERPRYDRHVAAARAALGDDVAFGRAWHEGHALTLEQAIELALAETVE